VAAAVHFYPGKNNLVIGMGSCITYNFVNQAHQFLGGSISPGMDMRFRSMHEFTAKLPMAKADWNYPLIGYDTNTNLQSGVIVGIASEIEGFIEKYGQKYGNFTVVLTGGNSAYFASQLKNKIFADHNFLFKGLYALSELNN
jgi:type III pantothenate kinase